VAEGIDQTRGWFYTLLVLGTALFDKVPFKNLVRFSFFCLEIGLANGFRILIRLWILIIIFFRFDKLMIWIRLKAHGFCLFIFFVFGFSLGFGLCSKLWILIFNFLCLDLA
jgi:hypothetical protein